MKKALIAMMGLLLSVASIAQEERRQPPPPEKRWEMDSKKISAAVTLKADQLQKLKTTFFTFYKDMDALRDNFKGQRPPKEAVEKNLQKRDNEVKKFLDANQFQKFVTVSKELGPRGPHGPKPPTK